MFNFYIINPLTTTHYGSQSSYILWNVCVEVAVHINLHFVPFSSSHLMVVGLIVFYLGWLVTQSIMCIFHSIASPCSNQMYLFTSHQWFLNGNVTHVNKICFEVFVEAWRVTFNSHNWGFCIPKIAIDVICIFIVMTWLMSDKPNKKWIDMENMNRISNWSLGFNHYFQKKRILIFW